MSIFRILPCLNSCFLFLFSPSSSSSADSIDLDTADPPQTAFVHFPAPPASSALKATPYSISGTGLALANSALLQERTYFELTLVNPGHGWRVGVTASLKEMKENEKIEERENTWGLSEAMISDPALLAPDASTVIGVSLDLSAGRPRLAFTVNGHALALPGPPPAIRGDVVPFCFVQGSSLINFNFGQQVWKFPPPDNFQAPIPCRALI